MKKFITDKILWDIYSVINKTGNAFNFIMDPRAVKFMPGIKNPLFKKYQEEMNYRKFSKIIDYLKRKNYIKIKSLDGNKAVLLTKNRLSKALKASFKIGKTKKRRDGKWIMLTFDIPEKHKKARILLRSILQNLDYKIFQQSIWICPHDVSDETEKLLQIHNLEKYVKIFLIEKL